MLKVRVEFNLESIVPTNTNIEELLPPLLLACLLTGSRNVR